jgi:hypothetical protein
MESADALTSAELICERYRNGDLEWTQMELEDVQSTLQRLSLEHLKAEAKVASVMKYSKDQLAKFESQVCTN